MKTEFKVGDRVRVIFDDKNREVPVGSTGYIIETPKIPLVCVKMDDDSLNRLSTDINGTTHKCAILWKDELVLESTPNDIEQTKQHILRYQDAFGECISSASEINCAETPEDLKNILDNHAKHLEIRLFDAQKHLNDFRNSLTFLK